MGWEHAGVSRMKQELGITTNSQLARPPLALRAKGAGQGRGRGGDFQPLEHAWRNLGRPALGVGWFGPTGEILRPPARGGRGVPSGGGGKVRQGGVGAPRSA